MKKNLFTKLLVGVISLSLLAGCGAPATPDAESDTANQTAKTTDETVPSVDTKKVYVSPEWVQSVIDGKQAESENYVILECAWGEVAESPSYTTGHIKGALHMNTDNIEEEILWNIRTPEEIEKVLLDNGITKDTTLIVYGQNVTDSADDRVAFTALWAGVENVKCLDGGLDAWVSAGLELETTENTPVVATDFGTEVPAHPEYITSMEDALAKSQSDENFKLVSVRSKDEFLGKISGYNYIDKAGEPKGAIWGHDTDDGSYTDENGKTADISVLEGYLKESEASFDNELAFYCGTGWRATIPFLISYENGKENISLYDGGWYEWISVDSNPVQLGDPKTAEVQYTTVGELQTIAK